MACPPTKGKPRGRRSRTPCDSVRGFPSSAADVHSNVVLPFLHFLLNVAGADDRVFVGDAGGATPPSGELLLRRLSGLRVGQGDTVPADDRPVLTLVRLEAE